MVGRSDRRMVGVGMRRWLLALGLVLGLAPSAAAQPDFEIAVKPFVDIRTNLFSGLASETALLPTPSGGGFTYEFDPRLGVFTRSSQSFGSVFGERAPTTGRGKFTFTGSYSRHTFDEIDGVSLHNGSLVTPFDVKSFGGVQSIGLLPLCAAFNPIEIREDIDADVFTLGALYGVTDSLDVGLTLPVMRVSLKEQISVRRSAFDADPTCRREATNSFRPSSAENTGIGDLNLRAKYSLARWSQPEGASMSLAASLDVKLPTGDRGDRSAYQRADAGFQSDGVNTPTEFRPATVGGSTFQVGDPPLGTGIVRVKPQLIFTASAGAFELNLAGGAEFGETHGITNDLVYQVGANYTFVNRVTVSADILGRLAINPDRPRVRALDVRGLFEPCCGRDEFVEDPFENSRAPANRLTASFGVKANPVGTLLLFVNLLVPMDDTGLRDDLTISGGAEWSF